MKIKALIITALALMFMICLVSGTILYAQAQEQKAKPAAVIIPPEVKTIMQAGQQTREGRMDIPFTLLETLFLPAQQNLHDIISFKVKNADLGFASPAGETQEKQEESAFTTTPSQMQANGHIFLQFNQLEGTFTKDFYIPLNIEIDGTAYDPEKEETYFIGCTLPPGKYLLSMAITSKDLKTIGTQHTEFDTPAAMTEELVTSPVFFVQALEQIAAPETMVEIHKGYFTYSILKINPNLAKEFTSGDNLDIFFNIFGAQKNAAGTNDLEITFEILKGEEKVVRYAAQPYTNSLVSQPLPLKQTIITKTTNEAGETSEKSESKDLEPGNYTLLIDVKDNTSGKTVKKTIDFTMK